MESCKNKVMSNKSTACCDSIAKRCHLVAIPQHKHKYNTIHTRNNYIFFYTTFIQQDAKIDNFIIKNMDTSVYIKKRSCFSNHHFNLYNFLRSRLLPSGCLPPHFP